jgi:hypothetical protein
MTLTRVIRLVYGLFGILYVLIGVGSMLLPAGWLPQSLEGELLAGEELSAFVEHLLQEFGTVVLALGLLFLWYAGRNEYSRSFHWTVTVYFSLNALIHWVGPEGLVGSWSRGIINSIPFALMLLLGLLELQRAQRYEVPSAA